MGQNAPAAHTDWLVEPGWQRLPCEHGSCTVALGQYAPALHSVCVDDPLGQKKPVPHAFCTVFAQ